MNTEKLDWTSTALFYLWIIGRTYWLGYSWNDPINFCGALCAQHVSEIQRTSSLHKYYTMSDKWGETLHTNLCMKCWQVMINSRQCVFILSTSVYIRCRRRAIACVVWWVHNYSVLLACFLIFSTSKLTDFFLRIPKVIDVCSVYVL